LYSSRTSARPGGVRREGDALRRQRHRGAERRAAADGGRLIADTCAAAYRNGRKLPIRARDLPMLTITIIFALLVAVWGRLGLARSG
jgi:hypothetical protein